MKLGRTLARLVIGGIFIGHGTQKLFGWFDGPGIEAATGMMDKLEMRPGRQHAMLASVTETAGGAMVATGIGTPLAATGLIATMITAIRKVHLANGPWNANGGYEFNLALIAGLLALVDSEDGPDTAAATLVVGAIGSTLAIELGRRAGSNAAAG